MEIFQAATSLIVKSVVLSAQWAGRRRRLYLQRASSGTGEVAQLRVEVVALRDENHRLEFENGLLRSRLRDTRSRKPHYTPIQRLQILWHMEYFNIPRERVKEHFGIAVRVKWR